MATTNTEKTITIKITSNKGDTQITLAIKKAAQYVVEQMKTHGLWAYTTKEGTDQQDLVTLSGEFNQADIDLLEASFEDADGVLMTPALYGGYGDEDSDEDAPAANYAADDIVGKVDIKFIEDEDNVSYIKDAVAGVPQLVVHVAGNPVDGETVTVYVRDTAKSLDKITRHAPEIISALLKIRSDYSAE